MNRVRHSGFTLLELMVTVAVIGILLAVGIPSYSEYARRAVLPDAHSNLSDMRVKLEQFYQSNRNYGTGTCANDGTATRITFGTIGNWTYTCALNGTSPNQNQSYKVTATGAAGRAVGHVYTVDVNNTRTTTTFKGASVTSNCWLIKGSEC